MLLKRPGFTLVAVITLALGIGMNAALLSMVTALILRPPPYQDPDRLVQIWQRDRRNGVAETPVSNADFLAWSAQARSFASLTAHNARSAALSTKDGAVEVAGVFVASNFFATLGATPQLGRTFTPAEERPYLSRDIQSTVLTLNHPLLQT